MKRIDIEIDKKSMHVIGEIENTLPNRLMFKFAINVKFKNKGNVAINMEERKYFVILY